MTYPSVAPTAIPSAAPTPIVAPTKNPGPSVVAAHLRWIKTRTNLPAGVVATGITGLAMRPGNPRTYLAISSDHRVWLSGDGTTWRKGGTLPPAIGGNVWWGGPIFVHDGTFVAFGRSAILEDDGTNGPYSGTTGGFVWTSRDGESWTRTQLAGFSATSVILDDGQFVATGGLTGQYAPTFATSPDGRTWTRGQVTGGPWPANPGTWPTFGAIAGSRAAGYSFLVGPYPYSDADCEQAGIGPAPIVWRSADLGTWEPAATVVPGCMPARLLISGPAGQLAMRETFLQDSDTRPITAWRSTDGVSWTSVAQPPGPMRFLGSLAVAPDGTFLALGGGIWESFDGEHWALSAPARDLNVEEFAGDLAIACGDDACYALRLRSGD